MMLETTKKTLKKKIPEQFIYEVIDREPIYYRGYKEAIKKHVNAEEIIGSSSLQSELVVFILSIILRF